MASWEGHCSVSLVVDFPTGPYSTLFSLKSTHVPNPKDFPLSVFCLILERRSRVGKYKGCVVSGYKHGKNAKRKIRQMQASKDFAIKKLPFERLVDDVVKDVVWYKNAERQPGGRLPTKCRKCRPRRWRVAGDWVCTTPACLAYPVGTRGRVSKILENGNVQIILEESQKMVALEDWQVEATVFFSVGEGGGEEACFGSQADKKEAEPRKVRKLMVKAKASPAPSLNTFEDAIPSHS
ncbi:LONP1 [Symbiodinium natans]|uniref:LONP1 protein n=1 Tax=Symbiodinium natans TaxID=878477 RepID=A0A812VDU7_9DINO|nr:LONP1 [Symbiodinium natans]